MPAPAADYWTALLDWLNADPVLAAASPGGFLHGRPGPAQRLPCCLVREDDPGDALTEDDTRIHVWAGCYATSDDGAMASAAALARLLADPGGGPAPWFMAGDPRPWSYTRFLAVTPPSAPGFLGVIGGGQRLWAVSVRYQAFATAAGVFV